MMKTSRNQSTLFQVLTTIVTRFIVLLGSFIVSIVTARLLGPEGKGIITALLVYPLLLVTIADLGLRQSVAFLIGKKVYDTKNITSTLLTLWVVSSVICLVVVGTLYVWNYGEEYSPWLLATCLLTIPCNLGVQYLRGVMQGNQNISSINTAEMIKSGSNILFLFILVYFLGFGIIGAALTQLSMAVVTLMYSIWKVKHHLTFQPTFEFSIVKSMLGKGFSFALALFVLQLNYRFNIVMLEHFGTIRDVGIYSIGTNIAEIIWQIPAAVGLVLFSKSAQTKTREVSIERTTKLIRFLVPLLIVFGIGFWVFAPLIITLLFGSAYTEATNIVRILLPGILGFSVVKIMHSDLSGRGYPLFSLNVSICSLLLSIALNYLLIPTYGMVGAAISSSVSYSLACIAFVLLYAKREQIVISKILILSKDDISESKVILNKIQSKMKKKAPAKVVAVDRD